MIPCGHSKVRLSFGGAIRYDASPGLSVPDDFHQNPLASPSVKLAIKSLLPRPEVQFTFHNRDDNFPTHHLPLQVCIGIVLTNAVVLVS